MLNTSTSTDAYVPSMLSFVAMESNSSNNNNNNHQKQIQLWDWDYNNTQQTNINNNQPIAAAAAVTTPFLANITNPFLDYQSSLLPVTNYPFYSPMAPPPPDLHHHHHGHHLPNGLIKVEDGGSDMMTVGQIGLNLGHRTYFSSGDSLAIDRLFRRSRGLYQLSQHVPRCQAEGCKADLSGSKHYHRRHKVCELHSKAAVVVANGLQQRFCQQCSRFHVLSEFDEAKRSCRKRLADHNRRRRKPQATTSQSSADLPPPNNSTTSSTDETNKQHQTPTTTHKNSRQICSTSNTGATATASNFSTGSMSTVESHKDHNQQQQHQQHQYHHGGNNKVSLFSNGPALSLGGEDEGNFGLPSGSYHHHHHHHHHHQATRTPPPPFGLMSEEGNSQYHNHHHHHQMSSPSSSATYYHHPHHNFFNDTSQSTVDVVGSSADHTNQQSNQMLHLGQGLFEMDLM